MPRPADPVQVAEALRAEEIARRAARAARGQRARDRDADKTLGEVANGCPECGPSNPLVVEHGEQVGYVPVPVEVPPRVAGRLSNPLPGRVAPLVDGDSGRPVMRDGRQVLVQAADLRVDWRPCFTCNRDRWTAWQEADLAAKDPTKTRTVYDRAQDERQERSSLR